MTNTAITIQQANTTDGNPDRDTLTADELAALAADGWNIEATA